MVHLGTNFKQINPFAITASIILCHTHIDTQVLFRRLALFRVLCWHCKDTYLFRTICSGFKFMVYEGNEGLELVIIVYIKVKEFIGRC